MTISAHQAYFGIRGQRHALLACSGANDVFDRLYSLTDRPNSAPSSWPPYFSGFPFEEYYVLMRTSPDYSGQRNGMVFTHAFLLAKNVAAQFSALDRLLEKLMGPGVQEEVLKPLIIPAQVISDFQPVGLETGRLSAVAHHLVQGKPVVWLGEAGFQLAVNHLWSALWPAARANFSFSISFNPEDLTGASPRSLVMGIGREGRHWNGYPVVAPDTTYQMVTQAERILLGHSEAGGLQDFMAATGVEIDSLKLLPLLEVGSTTWSNINTASFDEVLQLTRVVLRYASLHSPKRNRTLTQTLARLTYLTGQASIQNLLSTRNLDFVDVPAAALVALESAVGAAVKRTFTKAASLPDELELARDILIPGLSEAQSWWSSATRQGSIEAFGSIAEYTVAQRIWRWWDAEPLLVAAIPPYLPKNSDEALASHMPTSIAQEVAAPLLETSAARFWVRLHAVAAVALTTTAEAAIQLHIKFDSDPGSFNGIKELGQRIPHAEFIRVAVQHNADTRLLPIAGSLVVKEPALLLPCTASNTAWRQLWAIAVEAGLPFWPPKSDHIQLRNGLLDAALKKEDIPTAIWMNLAQQPEANLSDYSRRATIWQALPSIVRSVFLQHTAVNWVQQLHAGKLLPIPESELSNIILQADDLLPYQGSASELVDCALRIIAQFPIIPERNVVTWLQRISRDHEHLSEASAVQLGKVIKAKNWRDAARTSAIFAHRFSSWEPILHECKDLLSFVDKLGLQLVYGTRKSNRKFVNNSEWWTGLQEVAEHIFGGGPSQENLWERAGGKEAQLLTFGTGSEQWAHALKFVRTGGGGKNVSVKRLLEEMCKSRQQNSELQNLLRTVPN